MVPVEEEDAEEEEEEGGEEEEEEEPPLAAWRQGIEEEDAWSRASACAKVMRRRWRSADP